MVEILIKCKTLTGKGLETAKLQLQTLILIYFQVSVAFIHSS